MKKRYYVCPAVLSALIGYPAIANAQEPDSAHSDTIEVVQSDDLAIVPAIEPLIIDVPAVADVKNEGVLSDEELDTARGGSTIVVGNQTLNAVNSGGVINGDFSAGSINLSDNALTNFNGFGNLVINTGAQNNLQSGMNVTINFAN
jgi:hypothetical protein